MFIGREEELQYLEEKYRENGCDLILLYGRRRIGKTSLVKKFIENKPSIYLMATMEDKSQIIRNFSHSTAEYFLDELVISHPFQDNDSFFKYFSSKTSGLKEKLVIVFDELTYLIEKDKSFLSVLQKYYDSQLKRLNLMIIITGSLINVVKNDIMNYSSPIYGRRTGNIELKEMNYQDLKKFFPHISSESALQIYSIYGGSPYYLELLGDGADPIEKFLNPNNIFYNDPYFILGQELRTPDKYFTILRLIAGGKNTSTEISHSMNVHSNELSPYLEKLQLIGVISKILPIYTTSVKKGAYIIKSNFLNFYFRYVFPNVRSLELGNRLNVVKSIKDDINQHISRIFEDVCIQFLIINGKKLFKREIKELGKWWGKDKNKTRGKDIVEIDVVGSLDNGQMIFGEVKYTKQQVDIDILFELKKKSELLSKDNSIYILFSKSGFSEALNNYVIRNPQNVFLVNLDDVYDFNPELLK
jgi:AAA+ ATPase superfamily predicted ATPase